MGETNGTLYIVGTPIGNLKDITLRAIETLKSVDLIAAEDTRHTKILTNNYGIDKPLTSYFEHNKITKGELLIQKLKEGKNIALVSDSGMPGISDPGWHIINLAIKNNIEVTTIPGPTALVSALVLSGKPADKFMFEGFLPHKSGARKNRLKLLVSEKRTILIYESPYRVVKTLQDILEVFGDIEIACCRELTKKFEATRREKVSQSLEFYRQNTPKGEFVIVV